MKKAIRQQGTCVCVGMCVAQSINCFTVMYATFSGTGTSSAELRSSELSIYSVWDCGL